MIIIVKYTIVVNVVLTNQNRVNCPKWYIDIKIGGFQLSPVHQYYC
jgi:hypothetical protein